MYSRNHSGRGQPGAIRPPAHYSGVAFAQTHTEENKIAPVDKTCCAAGLPGGRSEADPIPAAHDIRSSCPPEQTERPQTGEVGGLFGGIGQEELLLIGIIFLLAQRPGEDDTILLLLLLLLRH